MLRRLSQSSQVSSAYRSVTSPLAMGCQLLHGLAASGQMACMTTLGSKTMSALDAASLVRDGDTIAVSGFVAQSPPELLLRTLGERYAAGKTPKDLTLVFHGGPGDWADRGLNHLAKPGMLRRTIGSHYGQTPRIADLVQRNEIEAYNVPMGTISRMIRAGGSGRSGYSTTIGIGTMADPRHGGGRLNARTTDDLCHVRTSGAGLEVLWYPSINLNVAIIRGTTADPDGNITMERESLYLDVLNEAMAARAHGGIVICQVERLACRGSLNPRLVRVPGALVDCVVVAEDVLRDHPQSFFTNYNPAFSGEVRVPLDGGNSDKLDPMPLDQRKIIARRAALALVPGQIVNLGIGMPEGVARVAAEEGVLDHVSLTTEPGTHGGLGASGHDFGPAINYSGLLEMHQQFDFYNGGGLDACFLGMAEVTAAGDVNVTRVGKTLTGPGGFIDISQSTQRVNLLGTLTAGGLEVGVEDGKLKILKEGRVKKFVKKIPEITFSGAMARKHGQIVKYITERCVFSLTKDGLALTEVAPGIDIQRDILDQMEFAPIIDSPREMNLRIFQEGRMGLSESLTRVDMTTRMVYSEDTNTLFIDLSAVHVSTSADMENILGAIEQYIAKDLKGQRVNVEVNYFRFQANREVLDDFRTRTAVLEAKYYASVRRHTGRTFNHLRAAQPREVPPETLTCDDAVHYVRRSHISASDEDVRDVFRHVGKGAEAMSRDEFVVVLNKLQAIRRNN